tara:strand:+ start:1079 stop:1447 length:369 start_codon:yes stop_codon:yes gene_type:complete
MAISYSNVTNNSAVVLVERVYVLNTTTGRYENNFSAQNISNVVLCNKHATDSVTIDLWIRKYTDDGAGGEDETNFYILNNVLVPNGATLVLNKSDGISFDNKDRKLYIQLSASDSAVDVIIN